MCFNENLTPGYPSAGTLKSAEPRKGRMVVFPEELMDLDVWLYVRFDRSPYCGKHASL